MARGGTILGAAGLAHLLPYGWPRIGSLIPEAYAAVVLDPNNPTPPFTLEGIGNCGTPGTVLAMNDSSSSNVCNLFAADSDAAQGGPDLDIITTFQVLTDDMHAGDEIGVRFVIDEAVEKRVVAACFMKAGVPAIGLAAGNDFTDQNSYPAFVLVNWKAVTSLRIRRTQQGAEIIEVNGVAPATRQFIDRPLLPTAFRPQPSVEFGCPSSEAIVTVDIHAFASERVVVPVPGRLTFTDLRIRDADSTDRLRFRADFTLGAASNGIDPATEQVTIKLSTPGGGQFYPMSGVNSISGFDVKGNPPRRRWSLSDVERARTGIERFDIDEDPGNTWSIFFRDRSSDIPADDFSTVNAEIVIGNDRLTGSAELAQRPSGSGSWRLH